MKKCLLILAMFFSMASISNAGWFSHDNQAYQRQIQGLQTQLAQQTHYNGQLVIVVVILATGIIIALVVGAAIGSKARRAVKEVQQ